MDGASHTICQIYEKLPAAEGFYQHTRAHDRDTDTTLLVLMACPIRKKRAETMTQGWCLFKPHEDPFFKRKRVLN